MPNARSGSQRKGFKPKHKPWVGRTAPNSLSGLHEQLLRITQEANLKSSVTPGSEATRRTGSWTKRPFLPTKSGIYRTFPDSRRGLGLVRSPNSNETGQNRTNSFSEGYL